MPEKTPKDPVKPSASAQLSADHESGAQLTVETAAADDKDGSYKPGHQLENVDDSKSRKRRRVEADLDTGETKCICEGRWTAVNALAQIYCEHCHYWMHLECVGITATEVDEIQSFICPSCESCENNERAQTKYKRKSGRASTHTKKDYTAGVDEYRYTKILEARNHKFREADFPRLNGEDIKVEFFKQHGFKTPIVIYDPKGLDMIMPKKEIFDARYVAEVIGNNRVLEVIDVATQHSFPMTLREWADYMQVPSSQKQRLYNVISLEISDTEFYKTVQRPGIVRAVDWIDNYWPKCKGLRWSKKDNIDDAAEENSRESTMYSKSTSVKNKPNEKGISVASLKEFPRVQLYCLMSSKDAYTDFHVDFGGTSVYYHIIRGSKIFYFIEPTETNLKKYEKWANGERQSEQFLGDMVNVVYKVSLTEGDTMLIPSGWIHAVYAPDDSMVIGGNFLHDVACDMQFKVEAMERRLSTENKFRVPLFEMIVWYRAVAAVKRLLEKTFGLDKSDEDESHELLSQDAHYSILTFLAMSLCSLMSIELKPRMSTINGKSKSNSKTKSQKPQSTKPTIQEQVAHILSQLPQYLTPAQLKQSRSQVPNNVKDPIRFLTMYHQLLTHTFDERTNMDEIVMEYGDNERMRSLIKKTDRTRSRSVSTSGGGEGETGTDAEKHASSVAPAKATSTLQVNKNTAGKPNHRTKPNLKARKSLANIAVAYQPDKTAESTVLLTKEEPKVSKNARGAEYPKLLPLPESVSK